MPGGCVDSNAKSKSITAWTDAWQVYEDVCIISAGFWMGSWRGNSHTSYSTPNGPENWGSVRLDGDDDLTLDGTYVRNVGMRIEGRTNVEGSTLNAPTIRKNIRRFSAVSWSSGKPSTVGTLPSSSNGKTRQASSSNFLLDISRLAVTMRRKPSIPTPIPTRKRSYEGGMDR